MFFSCLCTLYKMQWLSLSCVYIICSDNFFYVCVYTVCNSVTIFFMCVHCISCSDYVCHVCTLYTMQWICYSCVCTLHGIHYTHMTNIVNVWYTSWYHWDYSRLGIKSNINLVDLLLGKKLEINLKINLVD